MCRDSPFPFLWSAHHMSRLLVVASLLTLVMGHARADDGPATVFPAGMQEPQVAVAPDGTVLVVAAKGDEISVSTSRDGLTFAAPVRVAQAPGLMLGMRRGPRIAATSASVVVTAIAKSAPADRTVELLSWRSADGGATWQGPQRVNGAPGSAVEGLQGLAAGPDDRFACVWLDLRGGNAEVYVGRSADGGTTWAETVAYRSPEGNVCECCHPSVAWSAKGELAVMWRNWIGGSRDLWFALSKDDGKTFAKGEKLGQGTWPLRVCPMDGGGIAARPDGGIGTVWKRKNELFFATAQAEEQSLGTGVQGQIASGPRGFHLVWLEKAGGDIFTLAPGQKKADRIGSKAGNPSIAGSLAGSGPIVAAWATDSGVVVRRLLPRN